MGGVMGGLAGGVIGGTILLCASAIVVWAWLFYDANVRPYARVVPPIPARVRVVPRSDRAAMQRLQTVNNLLGEASSDLAAKRPEWARTALERALALEPDNPDATAMLAQVDALPEPALTPAEQADRAREQRVVELRGAAASFLTAGQPGAARPLLEEALALDPFNTTTKDELAHLPAPAGQTPP